MKWILPILALVLSSCTSYKAAEQALNTYYAGKSPDRFWLDHGPPKSSFRLGGGGTIYDWNSPESNFTFPGSANTTSNFVPNGLGGGTVYSTTTYRPPTKVTLGCSARIVTDSQHRVAGVRITADSWGFWTTSFAHEYFARERKAVQSVGVKAKPGSAFATAATSTVPAMPSQISSQGATAYLE